MKILDLGVLTSQIKNVYTKYDKEIPEIKYTKNLKPIPSFWLVYGNFISIKLMMGMYYQM